MGRLGGRERSKSATQFLGHQGEDSLHSSRSQILSGRLTLSQFQLPFPGPVHSFTLISGIFQTGNIWTHILLGQPSSTLGCRCWLLQVPRCPSAHWGPPSPRLTLSKQIPYLLCGLYLLSILSAHSRENSPVPSFAYSL